MKLTIIQQQVSHFFGTKELVCPHVYEKFGESAWQFLDARLLHTLYVIREIVGRPVIVNNWAKGGNYSQRGLRCNVCPLVKEKTSLEKVELSLNQRFSGFGRLFSPNFSCFSVPLLFRTRRSVIHKRALHRLDFRTSRA